MVMQRRQFLLSSLSLLAPRTSSAANARIEVMPEETIGTISPNIYGHFTEHLGGCIYDGIWVGEKSKIPNIGGIRKALIDNLKELKPPVIRWPGGCFADSYDWRDGVGPRKQRPRRTNFWADNPEMASVTRKEEMYDPNIFGSYEFAQFCKLIGAEPYFAANLRSLPAEQFYQWIEYCNSPVGSTTLADVRAVDGSREPFPVLYWGVGNEAWGCGGNFTAKEYSVEWRRFVTWAPNYGQKLRFIASGPNGNDASWTHGFLEGILQKGPGMLRDVY